MTTKWLNLLIGCILIGVASGCEAASRVASDVASARLDSLVSERWTRTLDDAPMVRLREGMLVDRLPDLSYERAEAGAVEDGRFLDALRTVDAEMLDETDRTTLETLYWETEMAIEGHRWFWLRSVLTPYSSVLRLYGQLFPALPLRTEEELDRFVALVEQVPSHVRQLRDRTSGQFERGIVVSRANLGPSIDLVRAAIRPVDTGPFRIDDARVTAIDPDRVGEARRRIADFVRDSISPALEELADFLDGPYAARAPSGVGISRYPDGDEYYRYLTRLHTTMDVTPEEVQRAGEEMLAEFRIRMAGIRERLGWEGTAAEFHEHLESDARFFPETADEVGERLREASSRMAERIDGYFEVSPDAPWDARRLAPELEPAMTYGYYAPPTSTEPRGIYFYNGSRLDERSWLGLTAISLHELIPGHHFQIARTLEDASLPDHRRNSFHTAFTEGWGSYASFLGLEAEVFEDLYSEYGLYILESFLAARLVVDPGMNYYGMSLEEARAFMSEKTLESETQIATESLRYSTDMPGQALAYQMGKRKLLELRARAEGSLGERFDLPRFHEVLLEQGSLPMLVLERRVNDWVARGGRR